jgi:biotin carboxyl carrier protein
VSVNAKTGDEVKEGDVMVVIESMKMQMLIKPPLPGQ